MKSRVGRSGWAGSALSGVAVVQKVGMPLLVTVMLLTACGSPGHSKEAASIQPTKVLQSVSVTLQPQGSIVAIAGSEVYLDETTGLSEGKETNYTPNEVVDDLPVRITTSYIADGKAGGDLSDLSGYTGRLEIDLTLENLTVAPVEVEYDAAGQAKTAPALVGIPLSIAAAASLPHVAASQMVFDTASGTAATNGIASADSGGGSVVQWATLLAPPQSQATTTLRMVADVTDFVVPTIDIAVQAGLQGDLSFEGVLASAFDSGADSELGMQQRAIELVAEVNQVLTKAGGTITTIRENLDETSDTLGVQTAQRLETNSDSLAKEMKALSEELTSLQAGLDGALTSAQAGMAAQLSQIVAEMNAMLGDTSGKPYSTLAGEGCSVEVSAGEAGDSLYSTVLHLSGLLEGYADANVSCRDHVVAEIDTLLGPDAPTAELCQEPSMTCALFEAKSTVAATLAKFVTDAQDIISQLNTEDLNKAIDSNNDLGATLETLSGQIDTFQETDLNDPARWVEIEQTLAQARKLADDVGDFSAISEKAQVDNDATVRLQQELAEQICNLRGSLGAESGNAIDPTLLEKLRAYVVNTRCDGEPQDQSLIPEGGSLEDRLGAQSGAWAEATQANEESRATLESTLTTLSDKIDEFKKARGGDSDELVSLGQSLKESAAQAAEQQQLVGTQLELARTNQSAIAESLGTTLQRASNDSTEQLENTLDGQVGLVSARVEQGRDSLVTAYNATIAGLDKTSEDILSGSKTQISGQKIALDAAEKQATEALDKQTVDALAQVAASTSSSTRNVTAASALLTESLNRVILDLGDPKSEGVGILGAVSKSAAQSDTADYQLALASQYASGYGNVSSEDISALMLRQAQFRMALDSVADLPAFHLEVSAGAVSQTIYSFHLGGEEK